MDSQKNDKQIKGLISDKIWKKVPFNLNLAKAINDNRKIGKFITRKGRKVRIICWDRKGPLGREIVFLYDNGHGIEMCQTCHLNGHVYYQGNTLEDLFIEIPQHE